MTGYGRTVHRLKKYWDANRLLCSLTFFSLDCIFLLQRMKFNFVSNEANVIIIMLFELLKTQMYSYGQIKSKFKTAA